MTTLQNLIDLKPNDPFFFRGERTTVKWRELKTEEVGEKSNPDGTKTKLFSRHFSLCFVHQGFPFTLLSMFPDPAKLEMKEYTIE